MFPNFLRLSTFPATFNFATLSTFATFSTLQKLQLSQLSTFATFLIAKGGFGWLVGLGGGCSSSHWVNLSPLSHSRTLSPCATPKGTRTPLKLATIVQNRLVVLECLQGRKCLKSHYRAIVEHRHKNEQKKSTPERVLLLSLYYQGYSFAMFDKQCIICSHSQGPVTSSIDAPLNEILIGSFIN